MKSGAVMMAVVGALTLGSLVFLLYTMVKSIQDNRTKGRSL